MPHELINKSTNQRMRVFPFPDLKWAEKMLWKLLHITGPTGKEKAVSDYIRSVLRDLGVPKSNIVNDGAHKKIPLPTECGNLIVTLPGSGRFRKAPGRLFAAHMDTVELAVGTKPRRKGRYIHGSPGHALGGDDRAGVSAVLAMLHTVLTTGVEHPPLSVIFTVREESGLWGARYADIKRLKNPAVCFSFDGGDPTVIAIQAPGSDKIEAEIGGIAAHAGGAPEKGVSAAVVASMAIAEIEEKGLHGLVSSGRDRATSNIGSVHGGVFHNIVCPSTTVEAEVRAYKVKTLNRLVSAYRKAFETAVRKVKNCDGKTAKLVFKTQRLYHPFRFRKNHPALKFALHVMKRAGIGAEPKPGGGGLDANWLIHHGIPTLTFGAGTMNPHNVSERIHLPGFRKACRTATALATADQSQ